MGGVCTLILIISSVVITFVILLRLKTSRQDPHGIVEPMYDSADLPADYEKPVPQPPPVESIPIRVEMKENDAYEWKYKITTNSAYGQF